MAQLNGAVFATVGSPTNLGEFKLAKGTSTAATGPVVKVTSLCHMH